MVTILTINNIIIFCAFASRIQLGKDNSIHYLNEFLVKFNRETE